MDPSSLWCLPTLRTVAKLSSSTWTTRLFEDMTEAESSPLLRYLYEQGSRAEFTYRHRWQEGDVLMWDNRPVLHAVIGDVGGAERSLHRVAVAGDEPR